ncbi:MAG: hypothetical protein ABI797_03710 [Chloroflexota bacterium]
MRSITLAAVSAVLLVSLVACSAAAPGPTLAPGATQPPGSAPTQAPPVINPGDICAGHPIYSPNGPAPSFTQDVTLNARFPTQVDGQPVTGTQSSIWLQSMCYYGQSTADLAPFAALFPASTVPQISSGNARVELDGDTIYIQAFRFPGADPSVVFSHLAEFADALGGDPTDAANSTVDTVNLGGKNVYKVTDPDGEVIFGYVSGDTLWSLQGDESTATKVFAAIQ